MQRLTVKACAGIVVATIAFTIFSKAAKDNIIISIGGDPTGRAVTRVNTIGDSRLNGAEHTTNQLGGLTNLMPESITGGGGSTVSLEDVTVGGNMSLDMSRNNNLRSKSNYDTTTDVIEVRMKNVVMLRKEIGRLYRELKEATSDKTTSSEVTNDIIESIMLYQHKLDEVNRTSIFRKSFEFNIKKRLDKKKELDSIDKDNIRDIYNVEDAENLSSETTYYLAGSSYRINLPDEFEYPASLLTTRKCPSIVGYKEFIIDINPVYSITGVDVTELVDFNAKYPLEVNGVIGDYQSLNLCIRKH